MARGGIDLSIFDLYAEPTMAFDADMKIVYQNDAFCELCGGFLGNEQVDEVFISPLLRHNEGVTGSFTYGKTTYSAVKNKLGQYNVITILGIESPKPKTNAFDEGIITYMSKDIGKILAQMRSATGFMKKNIPADGKLYSYAVTLEHEQAVISRALSHMELMYKRKLPNEQLSVVSMDARDVFESIMQTVAAVAAVKGVNIELQCDEEAVHFFGDKELLTLLILNLISNGIKFTGYGGSVTVKLRSILGGIEVKVTDNGIGIPKNKLSGLLSFNDVNDEESGMRLGLHICCTIAALHGGGLYILSEEGKGTEVTAVLMNKKTNAVLRTPQESYETRMDSVLTELSDLLSLEEYLELKQSSGIL